MAVFCHNQVNLIFGRPMENRDLKVGIAAVGFIVVSLEIERLGVSYRRVRLFLVRKGLLKDLGWLLR